MYYESESERKQRERVTAIAVQDEETRRRGWDEYLAERDEAEAQAKAWVQENKDPVTGFGMLYDESTPQHDKDYPDLNFSVDVKWAEEYVKESRWSGPGGGELEELLTEAVRQWARLYAPKGTRTSFVIVEK